MKSIKYIPLFVALLPLTSCTYTTATFDTDIVIVIDTTDRMSIYPTADEIISQLGLKDNPWQGVRITATSISDKDINDVTVLTLESENEWNGNILARKGKIQRLIKQIRRTVAGMQFTGTRHYSIVYRAIAGQANRLAVSKAKRKFLLVYSDLYEHGTDISFYDPKVIKRMRENPQSLQLQLEATTPLKPLKGLQLWFIYSPASFEENNRYMTVANFYQRLFTDRGASVHIANKFVPL